LRYLGDPDGSANFINNRRLVVDHIVGSYDVLCIFVDGGANSHELRLEDDKLRCVQSITLGM